MEPSLVVDLLDFEGFEQQSDICARDRLKYAAWVSMQLRSVSHSRGTLSAASVPSFGCTGRRQGARPYRRIFPLCTRQKLARQVAESRLQGWPLDVPFGPWFTSED